MKKLFGKINMTPKQVLDILLIVLLIIVVVQNLATVKVRFLFFGFESPLVVIIVIAFFIGYFTSKAFSGKNKKDVENTENKG